LDVIIVNFPLPERNDRDCGELRQLMSNIAKKQAKKSPHWKRALSGKLFTASSVPVAALD
jgi:hypothetical protein